MAEKTNKLKARLPRGLADRGAAEIAATVFCQNATLVSFGGGVMTTRSLLDYQITQGELREARVRIPAGQRLLRVEGDAIRTWQVEEDGATQLLVVELLKGVSPGYRLTLETEKAVEKLPDTFTLETPHALEVKRETGFVALSGSDELGLTVETARGLQKVDTAEFLKVTAQTNALASGRGLRLAEPGSRFRTAFRVRVESDDTTADMS